MRAHELFLAAASPTAASFVTAFLASRGSAKDASDARARDEWDPVARTLDEFLLDALHETDLDDGGVGGGGGDAVVFASEWKAFARGAARRNKSREVVKAWKQWEAFGGASCAAAGLEAVSEDKFTSGDVRTLGVARVRAALARTTAASLRAHILAERDAGVRLAAQDSSGAVEAQLFSRVLSPQEAELAAGQPASTTRWDVRLAWEPAVQAAVLELAEGGLGDAFRSLYLPGACGDRTLAVEIEPSARGDLQRSRQESSQAAHRMTH